jgi:hypothetical protein
MNRYGTFLAAGMAATVLFAAEAGAYPLDGYAETGIRRVEGARLANEGVISDGKQPPGALLPTSAVDLRLLGHRQMELPPVDPAFTAKIAALLGAEADRYGIAVLDLTDPANPLYAEHRGDYTQNVGSVGKLVVAVALFQAMADTWPGDPQKRRDLLRNTQVTADAFAHSDHHTIRLFDPQTKTLVRRPVADGDTGSLWEWLDWMLSVSSNSAAAMVMREAMLMRQFGDRYPLPEEEIQRFFRETPSAELTALFDRTFVEPLTRNGFDTDMLRQGSFFTAEGKRLVQGVGNSYGTARELAKLMLRLEEGRVVDEWSSRQIKRLLYMTERRIRYASSPALADAAVYYKSGSLYKCQQEEGFNCGPYRGNVRNYMNSVIIVESPAGERRLHYVVTLISNVLRKNAAGEHQAIATRIQRLLEEMHPAPAPSPSP